MLVPEDSKFLRFLHIGKVAMGKVLNIKFLQGYCHRYKSGFRQRQQFSISDLATSTIVHLSLTLTHLTQLMKALMLGRGKCQSWEERISV
ncbi:uncharacterized [Tachysurus ichikawai]